MRARRHAQRGQAIVLIALMMAVLVGFVALALDSARAFDSRRIMQDATDSAALAAAEYYQDNSGQWTGAVGAARSLWAENNRVYTSSSCNPGSVTPSPGSPGTPVSMLCTFGGTDYQLTITAEDDGPGGQTFTLTGQRTLDLALMQVLGQSPTITVKATSAATALDQARSPAIAGLTENGCFGVTGALVAVNIGGSTSGLTIVGDVVADGSFTIQTGSSARVAGNVLTRCSAPTNSSNLAYWCWPSGTAPSCTSPNTVGQLLSTAHNFVDPGYPAPPEPSGTVGFTPSDVVHYPGIYSADPGFGSSGSTCYFLEGGVYDWQAGVTFNRGIVSNELKPPDEPVTSDNTTRSSHQFWDGNSAACSGSFTVSASTATGHGLATGQWSVLVTSLRTTTYNSVGYARESAPSMCRQVTLAADQGLSVTVHNVPGATGYNVYAAPPGQGCGGHFGLVTPNSIANPGTETVPALGGSLGTASGSWDDTTITAGWAPDSSATPDAARAYPPDSETSAWNGSGSLPNQGPARGGTAGAGDRANENYCATAGGSRSTCPDAVTPGAVVMYSSNGSCFSLKNIFASGGDAFLFSGYQYDWLLNYEPASTTCFNTWKGFANSAAIGLTYTPGATVTISTANGFSALTGGVVASTVIFSGAVNLLIEFSKDYAPYPDGSRLTG